MLHTLYVGIQVLFAFLFVLVMVAGAFELALKVTVYFESRKLSILESQSKQVAYETFTEKLRTEEYIAAATEECMREIDAALSGHPFNMRGRLDEDR